MARSVLGDDDTCSPDSFVARGFGDPIPPVSERRLRSASEARTSPLASVRPTEPARRREGDGLAFGRAAIHCFAHTVGLDASGDTTAAVGPSGERIVVVNLCSLAAGPASSAELDAPVSEAGFIVSKLDAAGVPRWTRRFAGAWRVEGVAVDARGEIVLTGMLLGGVEIGGARLKSVGADAFVAKLDVLGNHRWSLRFGDSYCQGKGVAVDPRGNVYVTGVFFGSADLGAGPLEARGALSMFVARLDAEGQAAWSRRFGGTSLTMGLGISVREVSRVCVSGLCDGPVDFGGGPLLVRDGTAIVTVELDALGNHVMSRRVGLLQTRVHG